MRRRSLDERDLALLARLRANAREPLAQLARDIGLSRSAAQERLQRLERDGVIERYTVLIRSPDPPSVQAWLTVRLRSGAKCFQVAPQILQQPHVRLLHALAGDIDLLVWLHAPDVPAISHSRERLAALAGVASIETRAVLASYLEPTSAAADQAVASPVPPDTGARADR